jgi:hypothetical protein
MKLAPGALRRRHRASAIAFVGGVLALLALAWAWTDDGWHLRPLLVLPLFGLALAWPGSRAIGRLGRSLTLRPVLSAGLVGAIALGCCAAASLLSTMPQPAVHDEFSYLLAADTFARGRLTNPTHPMWTSFEAPHILHRPTYMSKYPPGQGLVMALGQVAFGRPIVGVWLSAGLSCGALTWMLAGWMPGRWALAGGLLAAAHPLTTEWSHTYWGGLVAAFGGALVLGAFRRIVRKPQTLHAIVLGVGLGILANSRPYEGLVLSAPFLVALGVWLVSRHAPPAGIRLRRVVLPLATVLALMSGWMLYYNYRITGTALTMPYHVYHSSYETTPLFVFQHSNPPSLYLHETLRRSDGPGAGRQPERTLTGLAVRIGGTGQEYVTAFFGVLLAAAAVAMPWPLEQNRWQLLAIFGLAVFLVGLSVETWRFPHYAAPAAGLALLVTLRAIRRVGAWRFGWVRIGRPLAQALWIFALGVLILGNWDRVRQWNEDGWPFQRARIAADLSRSGGKHLAIVRYLPRHEASYEWVYNVADIDAAPVVWAREMDAPGNARLLDYFKDRRAWLIEPDAREVRAVPYPECATSARVSGQC